MSIKDLFNGLILIFFSAMFSCLATYVFSDIELDLAFYGFWLPVYFQLIVFSIVVFQSMIQKNKKCKCKVNDEA